MRRGYRILSVEAADIYKNEQENGAVVGYRLPEKGDARFRLFKILLDDSLDSNELEKAYTRICRRKFSFQDEYENAYTLAVVNVKFNYEFKPADGKPVKIKELREHFYENGFCVDGIRYVRYKRSAGSSREGKCLFIDEWLFRAMSKWSECGLKPKADLASWESYKALSLSSIKGTIEIPLNGILFVPEYQSTFTEEVVSVEIEDGKLAAHTKETQITNDIWDGESLLDESLFAGEYADRHMVLLRNKFFKSCAFSMGSGSATEYRHTDKIVEIIDESKANINRLYMAIRTADEQEREVLFDRIADEKSRRDKEVSKWLTNENILILVLRHYEKNSAADWRIYAALINHPVFKDLFWELSRGFIYKIVEDENGEYSLYGKRFTKK